MFLVIFGCSTLLNTVFEYPNNILIAISVNATDISSVPVASHFVNVYFFGRLHSSLALI